MYDGLNVPERIMLGRGVRADAAAEIAALGRRVALVRSRSVAWADDLATRLAEHGCTVSEVIASGEPDLPGLLSALDEMRPAAPEVVVAVGGGSALDLGKALAALLPAPGNPVRHFEVVGEGLPLAAPPLPFVAVPTTSGTGADAVDLFNQYQLQRGTTQDRTTLAGIFGGIGVIGIGVAIPLGLVKKPKASAASDWQPEGF